MNIYKQFTFVLFFILIYTCGNKKNLEIKDLNFSDLDQQLISINKIKKTYLIAGFKGGNFNKKDTISIQEYNKNGNITLEYWKTVLYKTNIEYQYDSLNFLIRKDHSTDFKIEFNYNYIFNTDSLILYKYYSNPPRDKSINNQKPKTSGVYKFDKNGLITKSYHHSDNDTDSKKMFVTEYKYDSLNLLISKKINIELNQEKNKKSYRPYKNTTFYYTDKKIDSSISFSYNTSLEKFKRKIIYNNRGLIDRSIESDSLIIFYKHEK